MNQPRGRNRSRQTYATKSGKAIKLNQSISDRKKARKAERAAEKALYLSTLPKTRGKRLLYRLKPNHLYHYWFSRQGAITGLKVVGVMLLVGFFLIIGMFAYFRKDLPQLKDISGDSLGGSVSYYDRTGTTLLFQDYNGVKRTPVQSDQISNYMKQATVAIEDKNFYKEGAFDLRSILRAGLHDLTGGSLQGASTITEQLVKLNEGYDQRTVATKLKEVILAVEVDREYTKSEILTGYLNIAPYGGVDYGVQSAAEDYFRTSASKLDLAQSAMLAAIPQSPSTYSPYTSTKWNTSADNSFDQAGLISRQHYVLQQMVTQKYITEAQAQAAMKEDVLAEVQPQENKYGQIQDPYFVLAAKQQLENQFGSQLVNRGGLKVITTMNSSLENNALQDVANNAANVRATGADEEAMVGEDVKTGQIVMLVGGENFNDPTDGQINYANINVLPGSSVKPFVYSTLINNNTNVGAGSVLYDVQQPIIAGGTDYYPCTNQAKPLANAGGNCLWDYDFDYPGPESVRYALAGSRNVPAIKTVLSEDPTDTSAGHTKSIDLYQKTFDAMMDEPNGLECFQGGVDIEDASPSDQSQCYASAGIGDGAYTHIDQQVNGDSTLGRLGQAIPETFILKVSDSSGKTLYQWTQPKPTQAIKQDTAYIIDNILSDPKASYLQSSEKFQNWNGWDIAVKTGTQNNNFDGLMTAWTTQYAVVSWVGYHTMNVSLTAGHMETDTEPLTRTWMEQALTASNLKPVNWKQPSDIKVLPAYVQRTHVGDGSVEPGPTDDLFPSWYTGKNAGGAAETIDKVSGFKATSCTPSLAQETVGGANDSSFSIDIFYPAYVANEQVLEGGPVVKSSSTTQTDNVHNCNDTPPSVSVTVTDTGGGQNGAVGVCDESCNITVAATAGTHPLSGGSYTTAPAGTITISLSGQAICTITIPTDAASQQNYNDSSCNYNPTSSGSGTITATVVDSVLYSSSDQASVTFTGGGPTSFTATKGLGTTVNFSWSGGAAPYTVELSGSPVGGTCTSTSASSCTASVSGTHSFTLVDGNNNTATASD